MGHPRCFTRINRLLRGFRYHDQGVYYCMKQHLLSTILAAAMSAAPVVVSAQFVDDQFDGTELGAHWTFGDLSPIAEDPGLYSVGGGHITLQGGLNSDHFWPIFTYCYIEQDAPAGTDWEVIAKVDDWDPTADGLGRAVPRIGLQIFQDTEHFITVSTLGNWTADGFNSQTFWRFDPDLDPANDGFHKGIVDLFWYPAAPQSSIYFKVQKTTRGYRGFISFDGTDYLEVLNICRNPETPDGYMTNEKIRFFHAAGFEREGVATVPTPVKVDYIISNDLPSTDLPYADEEFTGPELGSQWDVNPGIGVGTMYFDTVAGEYVMTAGPYSDMWGHIEQPTYIFQNAPEADVYSLTMKGSPTVMHEIPFELWNSYGIWLWQDTLNWAFISNQRGETFDSGSDSWIPNNRLEFGAKFNGAFHNGNHVIGTGPTPEYLRILKVHDTVQLQYSFDNATWTSVQLGGLTNLPVTGEGLQVRLFSKRAFGDFDDQAPGIQNPPLDARFDWLRAEIDTSHVNDWQIY